LAVGRNCAAPGCQGRLAWRAEIAEAGVGPLRDGPGDARLANTAADQPARARPIVAEARLLGRLGTGHLLGRGADRAGRKSQRLSHLWPSTTSASHTATINPICRSIRQQPGRRSPEAHTQPTAINLRLDLNQSALPRDPLPDRASDLIARTRGRNLARQPRSRAAMQASRVK
jgi:hypothetical protein